MHNQRANGSVAAAARHLVTASRPNAKGKSHCGILGTLAYYFDNDPQSVVAGKRDIPLRTA
jgi:hypothetical protein